jgi:hypothetical protein
VHYFKQCCQITCFKAIPLAPQRHKTKTQSHCSKCFVRTFLCEAWGWLSDIAETCRPYSVFVLIYWRVVVDGYTHLNIAVTQRCGTYSYKHRITTLHRADHAHWHRPCISNKKTFPYYIPTKTTLYNSTPHQWQQKLPPTFLQWQSQHSRRIKTEHNTFINPTNTKQRTVLFRHN